MLNAAREVIAEADAAEQAPQTAETEAAAREWWAPVVPTSAVAAKIRVLCPVIWSTPVRRSTVSV